MKTIKLVSAAISAIILSTSVSVGAMEIESFSEELTVYLNGENVYANSENKPFIMNERTMVQIRPIFEKLGYKAEYDDATKTVVFYGGIANVPISFTNDSYKVTLLNSEGGVASTVDIDVPATIYNDTFYVPLRAFCEAVGSDFISIDWDDASRSVYMKTADYTGLPKGYTPIMGAMYAISEAYGVDLLDVLNKYDLVDENENTFIFYDSAGKVYYKSVYCPNGSTWAQTKGVPCYEVYACENDKFSDTDTSGIVIDMNNNIIGTAN